ncbi:MAG: hypothetical protein GX587_16200 [Bacteroidales bacterium]|nr:hypothetical protein [Bacteroidales bacterium]
MIEESLKIHDKFSFEIKLGFNARRKQKFSDFALNFWFFIPNSLDMNPQTYTKKDFYKDLMSNIRLITPIFLLRDIASHENSPFVALEKSFMVLASNPSRSHAADFEYHIKMFLTILKSTLRDHIAHLIMGKNEEDRLYLLNDYIKNLKIIIDRYRELRKIINAPTITTEYFNFYLFGDEFLSNVAEQHSYKLLRSLQFDSSPEIATIKDQIYELINKEVEYKKEQGYLVVDKMDSKRNRELIFRLGLLKKFAENELFLTANKKKDGVLIQQVYYSIAAGISMIFATAIAFSFQLKFGNFTMPLFVGLVVSYMLKDRIKELARYYFAHKLGKGYFDNKIKISLKDNKIGWSKEAMDFITDDKVPAEVMKIRNRSSILEANNRSFSEKIILYRRLVRLFRKELDSCIQYDTSGINDIIRFNISGMVTKMDNPDFPLFTGCESNEIQVIKGERVYYLNLVMQLKNENQVDYRRYRIALNRNGILDVESFDIK